ncbi:hypothetical protein LTR56_022194 [Elasticomyces elasticus]|nr:hypothetical protein LTR56_022194 [Elasticomyces elasticus]KAK3631093.1 hypothetical protein LTR22_021211 [Elasticomyces elasticus]KAK4909515.1 hypothetical protein LTR49_021735 [Elasticomyces elasticus]KAK5748762.1 hypothetical protein LTS12_021203 [Elasticomyces elasticus]
MWRLMLKPTVPVRRTIRYEITYGPSDFSNKWINLMAWLRVYHAGKGVGLPTEKQRGFEAAQPASDMVQSLMGVDWATVSSVLEDYRLGNWQAVPDLRVGQQTPPGDAMSSLERPAKKKSVILVDS